MGNKSCCCAPSKPKNEDADKVEKFLKDERIKALTSFKVLLLGAGEGGKSTVIKQLKIIHNIQMEEAEMKHYVFTLHNNTVTSMQVFIEAAQNFGYTWDDPEIEELAKKVKGFEFESAQQLMKEEDAISVQKLWKCEAIQKAWKRRNEFWNLDVADYYFENALRFVEDGYIPSEEDCVMARVRTTGIVVTEFDEGEVHFSVVDVAGQRSERKKWIHCFDDVKALVFVVSLPGYDQVLFEDPDVNRMVESLNLFQQIANNPVFSASCPIFLFLNKKDLFEKMLQSGIPLTKCFPEYKGEDVKSALDYVTEEFRKRVEEPNRKRLHVEYIAARFKKDVKYAWEDLTKVLIQENKKDVQEARKAKVATDKAAAKSS